MYVIDTNILIYFFDGKMTADQKKGVNDILARSFTISVISKIEFLGFKEYMNEAQFEKAKEFISNATVIQLTDNIIERTIKLRQDYKMKLADALIAATALEHNLTLVTRNVDDFKHMGVLLYNPFEKN